jgi:hypothetical protein
MAADAQSMFLYGLCGKWSAYTNTFDSSATRQACRKIVESISEGRQALKNGPCHFQRLLILVSNYIVRRPL